MPSAASANDPAVNAAVSASAGTGKTYLLITRLVRLLLDGARPDGVLALTFTRKAAAEMRERLYSRLRRLALMDEAELVRTLEQTGVTPDAGRLHRARTLYEAVLFADRKPRITTFHAFCQEILRRFPLEADIPAGYELLETTGLLEEAAWDALCLEATRHPDSELGTALETLFIECNSLDNTRNALIRGFVHHRSDWWAYTEDRADPVTWAVEELRRWLAPVDNPLEALFGSEGDRPAEFAELLRRHPTKTNLDHAALIERGLDADNDPGERFECIRSVLLTAKNEPRRFKASKTLAAKLGEAGQDRFLELSGELADAVLRTRDQMLREAALRVNSAWYRAGHALLEHYQTLKQQQRLLDFADLEWQTYRLLHDADQALWVQYKLDQSIDHLLLDEFQDTNPTQWQLLIPLLEEIAAGTDPDRPRSVFLVGDTKQSIYGFRRANPRLQHTATEWLTERLDAKTFPLSKSWRSAPAIMDLVNAVFLDTPAGEHLGGFAPHETHRDAHWGRVELLPVDSPEPTDNPAETGLRDPLTRGRAEDEVSAHYHEGRRIAGRIRALIDRPPPVEKDGGPAPLTCDDIFILIRNRTHAAHYERALLDAGIPFIGAEKGSLLESLEVQDIEALLNVLMTPFDNLALARVLRSPLFSAGESELLALARATGAANWYQRLTAPDTPPSTPALQRAARLLPRWHALTGRLPVHDLVDRIYFEGDVIDRYRRSTPPLLQARVTANLQQVLDMALQIDSGRYPSMMRFLDRLRKMRSRPDEAPDNPPDPEPSAKVRLMTIHAAKGLEAPVVFLADTAADPRSRDSYSALVDWPADTARPRRFVLCTRAGALPDPVESVREAINGMRAAEDANLLYVALTRARHMLVVSASGRAERAADSGWYAALREAFGRIGEPQGDGGMIAGTVPSPAPASGDSEGNDATTPVDEPPPAEPRLQADPAPREAAAASPDADNAQAGTDPDARRRGVVVHRLLEWLSPPGERTADRITALQLPVTVDEPLLAACRHEAEAVTGDPALAFLFDPEQYESAYKEVPVARFDENGGIEYGIIDRLVVTGEAVWVIDYKTRTLPGGNDAGAAAGAYRDQLARYATAVAELWPDKAVRTAVLFTGSRRLVELKTTPISADRSGPGSAGPPACSR